MSKPNLFLEQSNVFNLALILIVQYPCAICMAIRQHVTYAYNGCIPTKEVNGFFTY